MPTLVPNIKNRVRKLPKPSNVTQAMQPLFEAVSNAFYAIEDKFGAPDVAQGAVNIRITNLANKTDRLRIEISDNGIGLDAVRYDAFQTIDTDFKRPKGGKGVGRLFWLDAFDSVQVESLYLEEDELERRCFRFVLENEEQIVEESPQSGYIGLTKQGTTIICEGLREESYRKHFPKQKPAFLRYFNAQFIADFLVGNCSKVVVDLDGEITAYPSATADLVKQHGLDVEAFEIEDCGEFSIKGFACDKAASTGLDVSYSP